MSYRGKPIKVAQGIQSVFTVTVNDTNGNAISYAGTETIAAYVWPGGGFPISISPTCTWDDPAAGTITVVFSADNTSSLAVGHYEFRIELADNSQWIFQCDVDVEASPGGSTPSSTDLVTIPYVNAALAGQDFSDEQLDFLPFAVPAASRAVKRWCGDRDFIQQTYTEEYLPELDGQVRLRQIPVNQVLRVQANPADALSISADPTSCQAARVYYAQVGDYTGGITVTGLTLVRVVSGSATTTTLAWADYPLLSSLATAINALTGWTATVPESLASFASSELLGGDVSRGAIGPKGCTLQVYADELVDIDIDPATGMLSTGQRGLSDAFGPRWGPNWGQFASVPVGGNSKVKVTYNAGFAVIPSIVQIACAHIAKSILLQLKTDDTLKTESNGAYSYALKDAIQGLPTSVLQELSQYRILNA